VPTTVSRSIEQAPRPVFLTESGRKGRFDLLEGKARPLITGGILSLIKGICGAAVKFSALDPQVGHPVKHAC